MLRANPPRLRNIDFPNTWPRCSTQGLSLPTLLVSHHGNGIVKKKRLVARTVLVSALARDARDSAFALFQGAYAGANRDRFERDLEEKQLIILLSDLETGALKGFSTVLVHALPAGAGTVIYSGDTVIDREYWGQKHLQAAFARILLWSKLRAPRRKLYWFLLSKGYRTYMLLANAFPRAVPRYDVADDPALRRTLNALAAARFGDQYDRALGVVRYAVPHEHVRSGLAPITASLLANPHVRFFAARNPEHERGDELACLAEVRWRDLLRIAGRLAVARVHRALGVRGQRDARRLAGWTRDSRPAEGT